MRKSHGLLAAFSLMALGITAQSEALASKAKIAGIEWNPYAKCAVANGNPFYSTSKSQQVKKKRRAAQRLR